MTDKAILEAAAQSLFECETGRAWDDTAEDERQWYRDNEQMLAVVAAVAPLIRAQVLEEAAQVGEKLTVLAPTAKDHADHIAARIRALRQEQPPVVMPLVEVQAIERAQREFEEKLRAVTAERDALKERLDDIDSEARGRDW